MVEIVFLTFFLGLTSGTQAVEVAVHGPVAAVEFVVDGNAVARLGGPPWRARLDFGSSMEPHELVARALDAEGKEVGRARQVLNLRRPPAEVEILLEYPEKGPSGQPVGARLAWSSRFLEKPSSVRLFLDGKPVPLDDKAHAALPAVAPEVTHILSAEVSFPNDPEARKDLAFGGRWGEAVSTGLTAVPVRLRPGKVMPAVQDLQGWILADGRPVPAVAVEQSPAQLLIVRDAEAVPLLMRGNWGTTELSLAKDDQGRFVWPYAQRASGDGLTADLFSSADFTARHGGLPFLLARVQQPPGKPQRLADAVAVAGLEALNGNRRRAVLLVLSRHPKDGSEHDAANVSHYLAAIRVPLVVWSFASPQTVAGLGWPAGEDISFNPKLRDAFQRLAENLASQRILWIEGNHFPGTISLAPVAAEVVELVR
jgi:hypothetical protein